LKHTILNQLKTSQNLDIKYLMDNVSATNVIITKSIMECLISFMGDILKEEINNYDGIGTALKPAMELICVARKPLSEKNVALNVLKWGTGGINIDACRIGNETIKSRGGRNSSVTGVTKNYDYGFNAPHEPLNTEHQGRFPANIILDEESAKLLDEQAPETGAFAKVKKGQKGWGGEIYHKFETGEDDGKTFYDSGKRQGASRFFYCAKASKSERNFGCEELDEKEEVYPGANTFDEHGNRIRKDGSITPPLKSKNNHPTVKPIKLMEYLIKLVSKEGAVVLDPFLGSGTTAIASIKLNRKFIGIEKEEEHIKIANARIKPYLEQEKLK